MTPALSLSKFLLLVSLGFLVLAHISCTSSPPNKEAEEVREEVPNTGSSDPGVQAGEMPEEEMPVTSAPPGGTVGSAQPEGPSASPQPEEYTVALDAKEEFFLHQSGRIRVWIGLEDYLNTPREGEVRDQSAIPANLGQYAQITLKAPGFEVDPAQTECIRIVPTGSSVDFALIPQTEGEFTVSASVNVYETANCSGPPVPLANTYLTVKVKVDKAREYGQWWDNLLQTLMDNLATFITSLVALLGSFVLFLIRKKMKKKGFVEGGDS